MRKNLFKSLSLGIFVCFLFNGMVYAENFSSHRQLGQIQKEQQAAKKYIIQGSVANIGSERSLKLYRINPIDQSKEKIAETKIESDGQYRLEFDFTEPDLYRLDFPNRQSVLLAIDNGQSQIDVQLDGKKVQITGSKDSEMLQGYDAFRKKSNNKLVSPAYAAMRAAKSSKVEGAEAEAVQQYVEGSKAHRAELIDYTEKNIGSAFALYGTVLRWTGDDEVARLDKLVNDFAVKYPGIQATKTMQEKVQRFKNVAIGAVAPPLAAPTPNGEILSLNDVDAKYILIDFWASWCGPCISQIPDLKKVYADFHDKGFEILSVSVDGNESKWKGAIQKYDLNWLQISDLKAWKSELAMEYNVTFVPFNLIVDKDGVIVAKNLHSKSLYVLLEGLLE